MVSDIVDLCSADMKGFSSGKAFFFLGNFNGNMCLKEKKGLK